MRPARVDECAALSALCLRSKAHWGYDAAFLKACREELTLSPTEFDAARVCTAIAQDGSLLGVAEVSFEDDDAYVEKLFVEPAAMGIGIGAALFLWIADAARRADATTLIIEADPGAVEFYRRMGARDAGFAASGSIPGRKLPKLMLALGDN